MLAAELLKLRPGLPVILCTGYSESVSRETAQKVGIREFLMKPLSKRELAGAVRRASTYQDPSCRVHTVTARDGSHPWELSDWAPCRLSSLQMLQ